MNYPRAKYENLNSLIRERVTRPPPEGVKPALEYFKKEFDSSLLGVLFYGSCLREQDFSMILDFHVLVDGFWCKGQKRWEGLLNRILSPNVYNLSTCQGEKAIQGKYAVYPLHTFLRASSGKWLHPYVWGRFAQPSLIVYARDLEVKEKICQGLINSLRTFTEQTLPITPQPFSIQSFWLTGLKNSYTTELRAEKEETITKLFQESKLYFQRVTPLALGLEKEMEVKIQAEDSYHVYLSFWQKLKIRFLWKIRKVTGKVLSLLRLVKCTLTFDKPLEYAVLKLEKHSKKKLGFSPKDLRHPIIGTLVQAIRLYRQGIFK